MPPFSTASAAPVAPVACSPRQPDHPPHLPEDDLVLFCLFPPPIQTIVPYFFPSLRFISRTQPLFFFPLDDGTSLSQAWSKAWSEEIFFPPTSRIRGKRPPTATDEGLFLRMPTSPLYSFPLHPWKTSHRDSLTIPLELIRPKGPKMVVFLYYCRGTVPCLMVARLVPFLRSFSCFDRAPPIFPSLTGYDDAHFVPLQMPQNFVT